MARIGCEVGLRDILVDEFHQVHKIGGRTEDRPAVLARAVVLSTEKLGISRNLLQVVDNLAADVSDPRAIEVAPANLLKCPHVAGHSSCYLGSFLLMPRHSLVFETRARTDFL